MFISEPPRVAAQLEEAAPSDDGRHDFDFLLGRWAVSHRRLRERLVGNSVWEQFAGTADSRAIMGGLGNVDDNLLELPAGTYRAATLRVFDPATRLWSIWWIDGRRPALDPPVHGRFEEGVGTLAARSGCASSGRQSRHGPPDGSRPFRRTGERTGRTTG